MTLALLLSAVAPVSAGDSSKRVHVEDFSCDRGPLPLRLDRWTAITKLRTIGRVIDERVALIEIDGTQTRVFEFDGLAVHARFAAGDNEGLVETVKISKPHWRTAGGAKVGDSLVSLRRKFNRHLTPVNSMVEVCGDTDCVTFHVRKERIRRIEYACYTG